MDIAELEAELQRLRIEYRKDPQQFVMTFLNYGAFTAHRMFEAGEEDRAVRIYDELIRAGSTCSRRRFYQNKLEDAAVCFDRTIEVARELYALVPSKGIHKLVKLLETRVRRTHIHTPDSPQIPEDYRECIRLYQDFMEKSTITKPIASLQIAVSGDRYGVELMKMGHFAVALEMFRLSREHYYPVREKDSQYALRYAQTCDHTALCQIHMGRTGDARALLLEALDIYFSLTDLAPRDILPDIATAGYHMAMHLRQERDTEQAVSFCRAALGCFRSLAPQDPDTFLIWYGNAAALLADMLSKDDPEKEALFVEAIAVLEQVEMSSPNSVGRIIAQICVDLAALLQYQERTPEAIPVYWKALALYRSYPDTQNQADAIERLLRRLEGN